MLIETSGLADPAPILHALDDLDRDVAQAGRGVDSVVIDRGYSARRRDTLERHVEARRQVALADRLVFSKTDIVAPS